MSTPSDWAMGEARSLRMIMERFFHGPQTSELMYASLESLERKIALALDAARKVPEGCVRDEHGVDRKVILPVTADGEWIYPGMEVWCVRTATWKWIGEKGTPSYRGVEDYRDAEEPESGIIAYVSALGGDIQRIGFLRHAMSGSRMTKPEWLFSTREAAEAARKGTQ